MEEEIENGGKIIGDFLTRNREMESHELFKQAWHLILENQSYFSAISETNNRFGFSWQSIIYREILILFKKVVKQGFAPPVRGVGPDFITAGDRGALFMSVHSNLELGVAKFLQEQGHSVSLLALPRRNFVRGLYSLAEPVEFIRRQNGSLLKVRQALRASRTVMINVDYTLFDQDRKLHVKRANRAFLEIVAKLRVPLYWILPFVSPDGEITCASRRVEPEATPEEKMQLLDSLAKQHSIALGELSLGNWFKETGGKIRAPLPKSSESAAPGLPKVLEFYQMKPSMVNFLDLNK